MMNLFAQIKSERNQESKIDKRSESGRKILNAIVAGQRIKIFQTDN